MSKEILNSIISQAQQAKAPRDLAVVFDLDSTIFNVSGRTQSIMHDLATDTDFTKKYPEEAPLLKNYEAHSQDWGISEAISRLGLKSTIDFFKDLHKLWAKHFFSNQYLKFDEPYPGAVEFVNRLHKEGVQITYLTGRPRPSMEKGTLESLNQWNLPIEADNVELLMKPQSDKKDHLYKSSEFAELVKNFDKLWFFENEPVIIEAVRKDYQDVDIVFMNTVHSGRAEVPTDLPHLEMEFIFD